MLRTLSEKRVRDASGTIMKPVTGGDVVSSGIGESVAIKDVDLTTILAIDHRTLDAMEAGGKECEGAAAKERGVAAPGRAPLDPLIMRQGDEGLPIVLAAPDTAVAYTYLALADRVIADLALVATGK